MKFLFYISGHGLGHATRAFAIMRALIARAPGSNIYARTRVSRNVFDGLPTEDFYYHYLALDVGVIERDVFSQDISATLSSYSAIHSLKNSILDDEVRFVRQEGIDVIISDIPPLASEIGKVAGIPTIAIGNFSWDFIYEPYVSLYPEYFYLIDEIKLSYGKTDLLLRLPLHHEMAAFPRQRDIPFTVRKQMIDPGETRLRLGLSPTSSKFVVLVAIRMHDAVPSRAIQYLVESGEFIVLSFAPLPFETKEAVHVLSPKWNISEFPEIVGISDLVISKLGYGIVSECIVGRAGLVYIPRDDFAEYELLRRDSRDLLPSHLMPRDDFLQGRWYEHAKAALSHTFNFNWPEVRTDGAEIAADIIISSAI